MKAASPEAELSAEALLRVLERERSAKRQAEELLKEKCRQLFQFNCELQQSASALEREVQRNKVVFDTAAEGIIIFEDDGHIESINEAARRIFGLGDQDCNNISICDILPYTEMCQRECNEGHCFAKELIAHVNECNEITGRKVDGTDIPIELVISSFKHGGRRSYSGIVRDLSRRKALEAQLAHAQKLESVGQLAAGIAHELNTPIQFVGDNTHFLKSSFESINQLFDLIEPLVDAAERETSLQPLVAKVRTAFKEVDLDFLREEVPLAITQTLQGAESVTRIVKAMKVFSHPGTNEFQEIDLNSSLDSTLTVSRNEWKYVAEVVTQFDRDMPKIFCMPGELNQVFLNLIVNAAHAIQSKKAGALGKITVTTKHTNDRVIVDITDSGTGIPAAIRNRIFDPFFTTKGVGKGTGQGLAISYSIVVDMHKGSITFDTVEGEGTTFHVSLPLDPRESPALQKKGAS